MNYGIVVPAPDGRRGVLFERLLAHPVGTVWAAITDANQLGVWSPGIHFEARPNGRFNIWFGDECEGPAHIDGTVAAFEPQRLLQLGTIRFELAPEPAAGGGEHCRLKFSDVLFYDDKRTKTAFENAVLAGWHQFLDRLEIYLAEGRAVLDLPEPDYADVNVAKP